MQSTNAHTPAAVDWQLLSRSIHKGCWTPEQCRDQFFALDANNYRRFSPPQDGVLSAFLPPSEGDLQSVDLQEVLLELKTALESGLAL